MDIIKEKYLPYYTYDDFIHWEGDWELIRGTAYAMAPSPQFNHQSIASLLIQSIGDSIKSCKNCMVVSQMDYKIADDTILRPDIALVCGQKDGAYIKKNPELIVEIVSPSSAMRDEKIKFSLYKAEKVPFYVLLYPEDLKAKIYALQGNKYEKICDLLEGSFDFVFERFR